MNSALCMQWEREGTIHGRSFLLPSGRALEFWTHLPLPSSDLCFCISCGGLKISSSWPVEGQRRLRPVSLALVLMQWKYCGPHELRTELALVKLRVFPCYLHVVIFHSCLWDQIKILIIHKEGSCSGLICGQGFYDSFFSFNPSVSFLFQLQWSDVTAPRGWGYLYPGHITSLLKQSNRKTCLQKLYLCIRGFQLG